MPGAAATVCRTVSARETGRGPDGDSAGGEPGTGMLMARPSLRTTQSTCAHSACGQWKESQLSGQNNKAQRT